MSSENSLLFEKERKFREFQLWPLSATLDLRAWLRNFKDEHQEFALRLAGGFTFLSDPVIDAMLLAAVQRLVNIAGQDASSSSDFFDATLFVIVQGETPSVSDSGHIYARKIRDKVGVDESRILDPASALKVAGSFRNIVFVDDFIGSGQQMLHTWESSHETGSPGAKSFLELNNEGRHRFYYCATVCSAVGHGILAVDIPGLTICAAHLLRAEDSLTNRGHPIWRGHVDEDIKLLEHYSREAGYLGDDGGEEDWRGFYMQALGLAYWHSIPDATLPVFRSSRSSWQPLIRIKK